MEEPIVDSTTVKSESSDFELQTLAVAKESETIEASLMETGTVSSIDLPSVNDSCLEVSTIPVLSSVSLSQAQLEVESNDEIKMNVVRNSSPGNNNNQKLDGCEMEQEQIDTVRPEITSSHSSFIVSDGKEKTHEFLAAVEKSSDNNGKDASKDGQQVLEINGNETVSDDMLGLEINRNETSQVGSITISGTQQDVIFDQQLKTVDAHETLINENNPATNTESSAGFGCSICVGDPGMESQADFNTGGGKLNFEEVSHKIEEKISSNDVTQADRTNIDTVLVEELSQLKLNSEPAALTGIRMEIPSSLQDYECYFNWAVDKDESKSLTEDEAKTIEKVVNEKFMDSVMETEETALKYSGMEIISNKAAQAFCNIILKNKSEGAIQISEATELINKCTAAVEGNLVKDYADGMHYVVRGLHMLLLIQQINDGDEDSKQDLDLMISTSETFNCLNVKAQVGVLAMKLYFGSQRRHIGATQTTILEQLISMDDCHEWHYQLYAILRISRRDTQFRSEPDEREKSAILRAVELAPDHPLINLGLCHCILEIFKNRNSGSNSWKDKIELGSICTLKSSQEMVDFIKDRTKKVLKLYGNSVKGNIQIAEFFTVLVPYQFRDSKFAKQCITRALSVAPNSSRANHRMGIFCLTLENDPKEALKYFERALETDPRNFPALSDVIQTCLADPIVNSDRVKKILKDSLANSVWQDSKLAALHCFRGFFMYMKRDSQAAVDSWINAYQKHPDSIKAFKSINYFYTRYRWNRKDISLSGIQSALKKAQEVSAAEEKETIAKILEMIDSMLSEIAEKSATYTASRGGRGGRGSQFHSTGPPSSRPGTGINSNHSAPESRPRGSGYRGIGRGNFSTAPGGERNGNAVIREPRVPDEGRGFAPRGNIHQNKRGNPSGRIGTQPQPSQK